MPNRAMKCYSIDQSPFFKMRSKKRLASLLKISIDELERLTAGAQLYTEWDEPKKKGGTRHIENPRPALKRVQRRIARKLGHITPPDFLFCPVRGRSYVDNAKIHCGQRVVRTLDIRDYYTNTLRRKVYWFFKSRMSCSSDVAAILAKIATINGRLSTGSPLSPILSFLANIEMWDEISLIARHVNCNLTVYMDDLTISGDKVSNLTMWRIKERIFRSGLRYHKEKNYVCKPAEVTGLIVGKHSLSLPHRQHKRIHDARNDLKFARTEDDRFKLEQELRSREGQKQQIESA